MLAVADTDTTPEDLGIEPGRSAQQLFRWLLASLLMGRNVQQTLGANAYRAFIDAGYTSPGRFEEHSHAEVVAVLDAAHYTRYDESMAAELRDVLVGVANDYGSVHHLITSARHRGEAHDRLVAYRGVGETTARVFLDQVPEHLYRGEDDDDQD